MSSPNQSPSQFATISFGGTQATQTPANESSPPSTSVSPSPSPAVDDTVFIVNTGKRAKRLTGNLYIEM
ncbi:MAG: hypothetical protein UW56_C0019G0007 [Candidatus Collierbacteria bacterium GW2011_GWD1_44_27]|nr:MAG: hypothetical protein UW56_C0019G0007 [Candidatus Collierbacteria bacterium GW2011_GWD1_44_27]